MRLTLLPEPKSISVSPGRLRLPRRGRIELLGCPAQDVLAAAVRLRASLRDCATVDYSLTADESRKPGAIVLRAGAKDVRHPEGYRLKIGARGIEARARTVQGIRYAAATLTQLLAQCRGSLPRLIVRDEPALERRGVMLDISRDKVPSLATLRALIEMLASWKINEVQLYTEHTFAFRNHREVWRKASPLTGQDILVLDAFCRGHGVDLVPNQNSFGHMHRWLKHPRYRGLAEAPNGCETAWGRFREPFSLNPTHPGSIALLRELYDELLPHFSSGMFNVGCDETVDLGKDRNRALAARIGVGRIYLDFLMRIYREVKSRKRTMQFWGDIILHHPELVPRLPRDTVALVWGYEADHPFSRECARFAKSRIPFYVCPGTSSWNAILGRTDNAVKNILSAAEQGKRYGAAGLLNTDWGDQGHWQFLPVSFLGFAAGAAAGWNPSGARRMNLPKALDLFAFLDSAGVMGRLAWDLGNAYKALGTYYPNASGLSSAVMSSLEAIRGRRKQKTAGFRRALKAISKAIAPLSRSRMRRPDADLIREEFAAGARLAAHGALRGLLARTASPARARRMKRELARDLLEIMRDYRKLWLARNRPGGLTDSLARMRKARRDYLR